MNNRIIWNQPAGKLPSPPIFLFSSASIFYIQEHIIGASDETEKVWKRTDAYFWNLESTCSIKVYDFWLKTTKIDYLKKKSLQLRNKLGRIIKYRTEYSWDVTEYSWECPLRALLVRELLRKECYYQSEKRTFKEGEIW